MAIGRIREAIDDFVERAVATAGDDELAAIPDGLLGNLHGVAGAGGFGEFGVNAIGGQDAARLIEQAAAPVTAVPRVGVVDQERVLKLSLHFLLGPARSLILYNKMRFSPKHSKRC